MKRVIQKEVETALGRLIVAGEGARVVMDTVGGGIEMRVEWGWDVHRCDCGAGVYTYVSKQDMSKIKSPLVNLWINGV